MDLRRVYPRAVLRSVTASSTPRTALEGLPKYFPSDDAIPGLCVCA